MYVRVTLTIIYLSRDIVIIPSYSLLVPIYNENAIRAPFWILPVGHVRIYST